MPSVPEMLASLERARREDIYIFSPDLRKDRSSAARRREGIRPASGVEAILLYRHAIKLPLARRCHASQYHRKPNPPHT